MVTFSTKTSLVLLVAILQCSIISAKNIFHFGDSYSATGFDAQKTLPSKDNPLGNPNFPGNSILGIETANWVGMFLKDHADSNAMFYNYADFGACVNRTYEGCQDGHRDLGEQYAAFKANNKVQSADVVSLYFGTNDIDYMGTVKGVTYAGIIGSMAETMADVYGDGARHFVVFGMDPLYRTPSNTVEGKPALGVFEAAAGVMAWNLELAKQLRVAFADTYPDATVAFVDTWDVFSRVIDDPAGHGAPDASCTMTKGNANCLWYDDLHPGTAIQKEIAAEYAKVLQGIKFL